MLGSYICVDVVDVQEVEQVVHFDLRECCGWDAALDGFKLWAYSVQDLSKKML